ncbi:hypothetical protein BUE93_21310 [Chromobacterium amazonense]|uniref:Uncharacterized protein n=1 Tax=Chromobacterium amazonense TaxID=1382803 RepID=A0A2S9WYT8_9NEIS|nr:hypothetical protein BUE93_21310 [Chromobacterium amazonense]
MPREIEGKKFEVLTRGGKVIDSSFYDGSRGWVYTSWRKTGHCPSDIMAYRVIEANPKPAIDAAMEQPCTS